MSIKKKISALVLSTVFAAMPMSYAAIDTGLGAGNGGAVINNAQGGFAGINGAGTGNVDLNFNGNAHVNWDTLNVNKGESLNFNAINGVNGITVLNTVNQGMTNVAGQISANSGIGRLIISNPNGVLFNGATFDAAGDVMITTQPLTATFIDGAMDVTKVAGTVPVGVVQIVDSDFSVGGEFNILAPSIDVVAGTIKAQNGLKLVTENGQDYVSGGFKDAVRMEAVNIDGDVYIVSNKGTVKTVGGGTINGNLKIESNDNVALNYVANGKALHITGDADVKGNGVMMYARNTKVDGNLSMENGGGFLEVGNVQVGKDLNLKTTNLSENTQGYKHFVHVIGNNTVGGNLNIDSLHNIHIGNYNYEEGQLLDGSLTVAGAINAVAHDGNIGITINTTADTVNFNSENLNILTDGKALISANDYKFSAKGYIGGINDTSKFIDSMEEYTLYRGDAPSYLNIAGGIVSQISTGIDGEAYIASNGDMDITGVNASKVFVKSLGNDITILGDAIHADVITVGGETDNLTVETAANSRDYTLKYTNIRDAQEITIDKGTEITYEMANGENGWNVRDPRPENTTYLVVKGNGENPDPGPDPDPTPDPTPDPGIDPDDNENVKVLRSYENQSVNLTQVYTPVAYAADLDDDQIDRGVRKNVDGSVTVVRAYPMGK